MSIDLPLLSFDARPFLFDLFNNNNNEGIDFEDYRFKPNADNETNPSRPNEELLNFKQKGDSITGQVPYLEIDGLKLVQTLAICRYLATKYALYGNGTDIHRIHIDMVVDTVQDVRNKFSTVKKKKNVAYSGYLV